MCGIVGYVGHRDAVSFILPGLRRLEYRGYDSAGIATVSRTSLDVRKTTGRIADLEAVLTSDRPTGTLGVGHTRWATHGRPSEANAHPHLDCHAQLAVVHNGIIENYRELRKTLAAEGHRFRSQTDTEVIAHLIERYQTNGLAAAVLRAARDLRGAFAIACIASAAPNTLVALRRGSSPLVIGYGRGEMFVASDIPALLGQTREVLVLDEGELAVLTPDGITLRTLDGAPLRRRPTTIPWDGEAAEKSGYPTSCSKKSSSSPRPSATPCANAWTSRRPTSASPSSASRIATSPASTASASSPAAPPGTPPWSASTWSKSLPASPSRSTSPPSSAIAAPSSTAVSSPCPSPSPGKPPIPWQPSARPRTRAPARSPSAMWSAAPWPARPTASSTPARASRSGSPRRKPSRPSSSRSPSWPSSSAWRATSRIPRSCAR